MEKLVVIDQNAFGRYILTQLKDAMLGWSGSYWVPIDTMGFPAGGTQVSNFDTKEQAMQYAASFGFEIVEE